MSFPENPSSMHFGLKVKYWMGKSVGFILLILFLGYYGAITLFPHSHVVNGVTLVHSHPYKLVKGSGSSNLQHTGNDFMLIQLLSGFITTAFVALFVTLVLRFLLFKIVVKSANVGYAEPGGYHNYSLRAPPYKIQYK